MQNSFVMALIKREIIFPVVKSCTQCLASVISFCFAKKMLSKIWIFLLKCQLKPKKIDTMFVKIFQVSAVSGTGK